MNNIEKELSESVCKAIEWGDKEVARIYYNRYKIYCDALELSIDQELFLEVHKQYQGFIKSFEEEKDE